MINAMAMHIMVVSTFKEMHAPGKFGHAEKGNRRSSLALTDVTYSLPETLVRKGVSFRPQVLGSLLLWWGFRDCSTALVILNSTPFFIRLYALSRLG
jgi:hypothetical protein